MKEIPHLIHYCWFGEKALPKQYEKYIETWKDAFPDYKIIEWNENNFPVNKFKYAREALEKGKMAFVSDVARIYALYQYGGIYFDTDVEVIKEFSKLLKNKGAVLGTESEKMTIGTGFMAFVPHHIICEKMIEYYQNNSFLEQSSTMSNTQILADLIKKEYGVEPLEKIQEFEDVIMYPSEYFTAHKGVTDKTSCIHHFSASWLSPTRRFKDKVKRIISRIKIKSTYKQNYLNRKKEKR